MKEGQRYKSFLSPLEFSVLKVLWVQKRSRVREIYETLKVSQKVVLSSVAVILDRLHEKGIVDRTVETARGGLRYVYFPLHSKKQFEQSLIEKSVNSLIERFGSAAVSYFNERFKE